MKTNNLLGKYFEMLNIDGSVMLRFKINLAKEETTPMQNYEDGSVSQSKTHIFVSETGSAWYRIYGGKTDRIVKN